MSALPPEPRAGAGPTEDDEVLVLGDLYGAADPDGVYRGGGDEQG